MARYSISPDQSRVWIDARSSLHPIHSTTDGLEGHIEFDPETAADGAADASGELSFPVVRLSSGNRLEDRELQKRIDARRFPTIGGVLTAMERGDHDGRYRLSGEITFRGVKQAVEDEMDITVVDNRTLRLEGQSTFDIRDFGMEPPRILMLRVEPNVVVRVEIIANRDE